MSLAFDTTMQGLKMRMLRVVPYNKELLKAWNGHINVQRVTQLGLVRYLKN